MISLEAFSASPPVDVSADVSTMLLELGAGEAGFGGTEFGRGEMSLADYLKHTVDELSLEKLPAGRVPQTTFWILENNLPVGLLRMRHVLNEATRIDGGHIGYYIRPSARRKGIATQALGLALLEIAWVA